MEPDLLKRHAMNGTCEFLDSVDPALERVWGRVLARGGVSRLAVLLALADFDACPQPLDGVALSPERRMILADRLSEKRLPRRRLLRQANALLPGVARLRGPSVGGSITPDHFGVIVHRLRRQFLAEARRTWDQESLPKGAQGNCNKRGRDTPMPCTAGTQDPKEGAAA